MTLKTLCLASTKFAAPMESRSSSSTRIAIATRDEGPFEHVEMFDKEVQVEPSHEDSDDEEKQSRKEDDDMDEDDNSESESESTSDSDWDSDEDEASASSSNNSDQRHVSCILEAQLSADGTCIFTSDYDRAFSVYPIGFDIFEGTEKSLTPYAKFSSADPIWAFASNPLFNFEDATSTHVLVSHRDQYINLHNALWDVSLLYDAEEEQAPKPGPVNISTKIASYKLIDHLTEAINAPVSLTYSHDGTHFFAGVQNGIAIFDLEDPSGPMSTIATIPSKRSKMKGGGVGFKGYISALSVSAASEGTMLAAGSRTRNVGIYDTRTSKAATHFALVGTVGGRKVDNPNLKGVLGDGVSYLKWSPCGKYLYVAERQSDAILIYDVRSFSLALGHCSGRNALTKQKLGFDIWSAGDTTYGYENASQEIWAGGMDGMVRVWKDPQLKEGPVEADEVVEVGDAPVVGTMVHISGNLAVAASGRKLLDDSNGERVTKGGQWRPRIKDFGCLDILGLG